MNESDDRKELEEQIADNLRRAFRQRADEDVPDRFHELLRKLKEQEETQDAGG